MHSIIIALPARADILIFYRVQESAIEIVRVLQGVQDIERILDDES